MSTNVFTYRSIKLFILFSAVILILSSCDIVDAIADVFNGEDDDITDVLINSTTIGTDGGIINADELTLTIPADAFSQAVDINIYESSVDDGSIDDIATKVYKIEGLPDQYSKPIDVSIKHNGNLSNQSYLVLQEETYIPSLDSISASNIYFDAVVVGDSIKSQLPAMTADLAKVASVVDTWNKEQKLMALSNRKTHTTSVNHFIINYNSSLDNEPNIIDLGKYLEDAYTKIQGLGFSYARRTNWPVQVYIENLPNDIYGYFKASYWSLNYDYMRFNRKNLSEQTDIKTVAIHEFFHLVQYLYDDRFAFNRAGFQSPHHWFNEACSVWSEELVTNSKYISDTKGPDTALLPFKGLQAGSEVNASNHGYGMSAFVKYIVKKYGQNVLVNIYSKLFAGKHVVDAINQSMNEMLFIDYNLFLQQYADGQLYPDVGLPVLLDNIEDEFEIKTDDDTLKTFTAKYRELSAKIYYVKLDNPNFKDNASLEISIDQDLCDITVFKYPKKKGPFSVLAEGSKSCIVSDIKDLKKQNKHLFVMVTNGNCNKFPSYSPSNKNIVVTMKVNNTNIVGAEIEIVVDDITLRYNDKTNTGSGGWVTMPGQGYSWWFVSGGIYDSGSTGSLNNNVYRATLVDLYPDDGNTVSGYMSITFLTDPRRVNFHVERIRSGPAWPTGIATERTNIDYIGVPIYITTDDGILGKWDIYKVSGSSVSTINISYSSYTDAYDEEYVSHGTCSADAYIEVKVKYE